MPEKEAYSITCDQCGKRFFIEAYPQDVDEYLSDNRQRLIQDIFPYLTADERELIISHTCPECFKEMFGSDE